MKRTWLVLVAAILLSSTSGCLHHQGQNRRNGPCADGQCRGLLGGLLREDKACGHPGPCGCRHQAPPEAAAPAGPPTAQSAYPYYTLHGPRDFLLNNPPSLGK